MTRGGTTTIPELAAIRAGGPRIKSFVAKHGERSAGIFARALCASFSDPDRFVTFLETEPDSSDPVEACAILRRIGRDAAPLVPELIAAYYMGHVIDQCV